MLDMTLSALDQFLVELQSIPVYSDEEQSRFVSLARQGDAQARHKLVESLLRVVFHYAKLQVARVKHLTLLDIAQMGYEVLLEYLDRGLQHPNPIGYLCKVVRGQLLSLCMTHDSVIVTPDRVYGRCCVASLDVPISGKNGSAKPFADFLPVPSVDCSQERDHTALYQALEQLSEEHRSLLARRYGLFGQAPASQADVAREMFPGLSGKQARDLVVTRERRALEELRRRLSASYLPDGTEMPEEFYTGPDLSRLYGVSSSQVRTWVRQGRLMCYPAPPELVSSCPNMPFKHVYAKAEVDALLAEFQRLRARCADPSSKYYTMREVMAVAGVSENVVRRWVEVGKLQAHRVWGEGFRVRVMYGKEDVGKLLAARREPAGCALTASHEEGR